MAGETTPLLEKPPGSLRLRDNLSSLWRSEGQGDSPAKPPIAPSSSSLKHQLHLGLTTLQARQALVDAVDRQLQQQKQRAHPNLWFGFVDTPMWILFLCATIRMSEFGWREHRILDTKEPSHFMDLVESIVLFLAAIFNGILNMLLYRREAREVSERVHYAVKVLCKPPSPQSPGPRPLKRDSSILAPSSCCVACYRDLKWQSVPMNLLVEGDVVALMSGDVAPGRVRRRDGDIVYARGEKIPSSDLPHDTARANMTFQPDLVLSLCGDMHVYTMEETPVVQDIFNSVCNVERPATAIQILQDGSKYLASVICVVFGGIVLASIAARGLLLPEPVHHIVNHACLGLFVILPCRRTDSLMDVASADLMLCFVSLHTPFVWCMGEACATSHLLTAFEAILESESEVCLTPTEEDDMDVYDVEEREQSRMRKTQRTFAVERSWYYFWMTLQFRFMDCADAHRTRYHNGKKSKLMIPYSGVRLLERLGSTTMLCCFDDDVLCEDSPCTEEIFLLTEDTHTVLDLLPEAHCTTGEKFEDPKWRVHLPSLKPLGLSILLNDCEDPKTEYIDTLRYLSNESLAPQYYDMTPHMQSRDLGHCLQQLSGYVRLLPYPRHLLHLAKAIGFRVDDLAHFNRRQSIHVIAPRLAHEEHTSDHHDQGQEDTRYRGHLKTHLYSTVVLDKRSHGHQLLSRGHPSLAVSQCSEYWDGKSICPLSKEKRREILDMYNQWRVEDLDCVALTYAPVAQKCSALFAGADDFTKLPPVFLVEDCAGDDKVAHHTPLVVSPILSSGGGSTDGKGSAAAAVTIAQSPTSSSRLHATSSTGGGPMDEQEELWKIQDDQIFLGMVASGVQPRKGMVGLIEDLTASGIRFVYFSPRNMRRSKLLAEKMGIETDWNCAISLRDSDGPDPHRMTSNYSDWDVKARLPHGTAAIRRHLETVDNVPLLVSLYTDSTPETIEEMIAIFQEYHEVVLGVGTSLRESNVPLFSQADLAVAFEGNPHTLFDTELPKGTNLPVFSEADMELSQMLNTLTCSFTVRNFGHKRASPMILVDLIRLGRHMLTNFVQLVHYIFVMQLYVATVVFFSYVLPFPEVASLGCLSILWLLWVVVPSLSLSLLSSPPDKHIMTRTPRKNEPEAWQEDVVRLSIYFLFRYVPSAIFVNLIFQFIFGLSLQFTDGPTDKSWWFFTSQGPKMYLHPRPPAIMAALDRAEAFLLLAMGWFCIFSSMTHLYRSESIFMESPFRNRPWMATCVVLFFLQIGVSVLRAGGATGVDTLSTWAFVQHVPWYFWLALLVWPLVAVLVDEIAKRHDHHLLVRYYKFLRMQFDTRLGMWSPK
ncbi:Aste57867_24783 [Aphanomyces stellatus]|uniref:Aste57867_24783 protein n=1 Tax=Aphanomyces stellatus TaxID=120398 RepID=A0A485LTF4_9STRA|nr:hypothetical protein As57867_024705 [Aphanomyces stellatus]VFU01418.1 Aste57867_24783 [Aphanomyces stellatus]